jgi:hypothetical protein
MMEMTGVYNSKKDSLGDHRKVSSVLLPCRVDVGVPTHGLIAKLELGRFFQDAAVPFSDLKCGEKLGTRGNSKEKVLSEGAAGRVNCSKIPTFRLWRCGSEPRGKTKRNQSTATPRALNKNQEGRNKRGNRLPVPPKKKEEKSEGNNGRRGKKEQLSLSDITST